jgi:hypothetical protein
MELKITAWLSQQDLHSSLTEPKAVNSKCMNMDTTTPNTTPHIPTLHPIPTMAHTLHLLASLQ